MSESPGRYRLLSPLSRMEPDAGGTPQRVRYAVGDVITPTEAELRAFGDRLEPVPEAPAQEGPPPPDEPPPDATTRARAHR